MKCHPHGKFAGKQREKRAPRVLQINGEPSQRRYVEDRCGLGSAAKSANSLVDAKKKSALQDRRVEPMTKKWIASAKFLPSEVIPGRFGSGWGWRQGGEVFSG